MNNLLYSYQTLLHLLTNIMGLVQSIQQIQEKGGEVRRLIQFRGHFHNNYSDALIGSALINFFIVMCNSFMDEYNEQFTSSKHPEFAERINILKRRLKPVKKRINYWKDLKNFRNHIIAHNLRPNDKSIFDNEYKINTYTIPNTLSEIELLAQLFVTITSEIEKIFPEFEAEVNWKSRISESFRIDSKEVDVIAELKQIQSEIEKIK